MKLLKKIFIFASVFTLTSILLLLLGIGGISYYSIHKFRSMNLENEHNLTATLKIGTDFLNEIKNFEELKAKIDLSTAPKICATLCNPSSLTPKQLVENKTFFLSKYYQSNKKAALTDPFFRLKLEQMTMVTESIPKSLRTALQDILESQPDANEFLLAAHVDLALMSALSQWPDTLINYQQDSERIHLLRTWMNTCHKNGSNKKVLADCNLEFQ